MGFSLDDLGVHPPNRQGIYKFWETYWLTKAAQGGWQAAQLALGKEEATNNVAAYMGVDNQDLFVHELLFDCPDFPAVPEGATTQALMAYPRPYPEFDKAVMIQKQNWRWLKLTRKRQLTYYYRPEEPPSVRNHPRRNRPQSGTAKLRWTARAKPPKF